METLWNDMETLWNPGRPDTSAQFGITDAELWDLVGICHSRFRHQPANGACVTCGQEWPCKAEQLASLTGQPRPSS